MMAACQGLAGLCGVIVEGGHPGLQNAEQRAEEVGEAFADYSRLYVDLPGHGGSAAISVDGFDDVTDLLRKTLVSYNILDYWLVG